MEVRRFLRRCLEQSPLEIPPPPQVGQAVGLAALATIAAARTASADGSLVRGYQLSFLVSVGIVAVAFATVLLQPNRPDNVAAPA